jgi:hypothetical protein
MAADPRVCSQGPHRLLVGVAIVGGTWSRPLSSDETPGYDERPIEVVECTP